MKVLASRINPAPGGFGEWDHGEWYNPFQEDPMEYCFDDFASLCREEGGTEILQFDELDPDDPAHAEAIERWPGGKIHNEKGIIFAVFGSGSWEFQGYGAVRFDD